MVAAVVGANGFIGSNLVLALLRREATVYSVYHSSIEKIAHGSIPIKSAELCKRNPVLDVIYLAVGNFSSTPESLASQAIDIENILSTIEVDRVVFCSSVSVYGIHDSTIGLHSGFEQVSAYGRAKADHEAIVARHDNHSILRFTYVYGKGMPENSLIPRWISSARTNREIVVYGNGSRVQDYINVNDAINLCIMAGEKHGNRKLIGATGKLTSNLRLAELIKSHFSGCKLRFEGLDHSPSFAYDVTETSSEFSWNPTPIEKGIEEMLNS